MKTCIKNVPDVPVGLPYSPGVVAEGKFLYVSGQGPYEPELKKFVRGSITEQTNLTLACLKRVIDAAGAKLEDVVSCRIFLQQLTESNFAEMNVAYAAFFGANPPARTTIGCQLLNIDVEIDCVVRID